MAVAVDKMRDLGRGYPDQGLEKIMNQICPDSPSISEYQGKLTGFLWLSGKFARCFVQYTV